MDGAELGLQERVAPDCTNTPARIAMKLDHVSGSMRTYRAVTTAAKSFRTTASPCSTFPGNDRTYQTLIGLFTEVQPSV